MSVTKSLLELFRVDKLHRGLKSRLDAAERFLAQQSTLLADLEKAKVQAEAQLRQFKAVAANEEGEAARLEARMATLREQMNSAKTAKEYNAFLSELNTFKEQKSEAETRQLEAMNRVDELSKKLADATAQHADRARIVEQARVKRDEQAAEIKDRLDELAGQRSTLASAVPAGELRKLEDLIKLRGDDAMAHVEVLDRRSHEGTCSACMMAIPVEVVSGLMSGKLVNCPNCRCILYVEQETFAASSAEARKKPRKDKPAKDSAGAKA
jgi:predicted  nucleic acid-binding Zn-ribbon protein